MSFPRHLVKKWGKEVGWACESCGRRWKDGFKLEGHHIRPTHQGGEDTRENFKLLCLDCHEDAHRALAELDWQSAEMIHARKVRTRGRWF